MIRGDIRRALFAAGAILLTWTSLLCAQQAPQSPASDLEKLDRGDVRHVIAPNAIVVRVGSAELSLRLRGVKQPESDDDARDCQEFLARVLEGEEVAIDFGREPAAGKPGQIAPAMIYRLPEGLCVNVETVRQGYARVAPELQGEDARAMTQHESRAKRLGKGVWAAAKPASVEPPAAKPGQPRESAGATDEQVYITASGRKYHRAGCKYLSDSAKLISLAEARKSYEPCSRCKPPR